MTMRTFYNSYSLCHFFIRSNICKYLYMNMHFGYFLNYSEIKEVCQLAEMHCEKLINQITQH